jgi:serine-type D-Ala-D-Ala carboxypeptidase/endopeptidase (penicillin-binding protein 4)
VRERMESRFVQRLSVLFVVCFWSWAPCVRAQTSAPPPNLAAQLDQLMSKLPKGAQAGLLVVNADNGAVWFSYQPDLPLKPASVQKLFVTAAALDRFGPQFRYQTRAYLAGDELWVVGAGDPELGDERLATRDRREINEPFDEWAEALRAHNQTALRKVVLDDSVFDDQVRHPDWPADQSDRWYQAPVGGLNLNDNCLDVTVVVRDGRITLRLQPDLSSELIQNTLRLGKKQHAILKRPAGSNLFQLSGTVANGGPLDPVSVGQPGVFFAHALRQALERRSIEVRGDVVRRQLTAAELSAATLLATHTTPLPDVLWRCNTFSQNMFADCLLKSLAAYEPDGRRSAHQGTWSAGEGVLRATLARLGVDLDTATLRDGSGLSHENLATATQFTRLLVQMRRHPHADVFLKSLAQAGELGSMKNRYGDPLLRGRLRGKTGTLAGVHTLAGYLTRPDNTVLAFALLINGPGDPGLPAQVCRVLLTN